MEKIWVSWFLGVPTTIGPVDRQQRIVITSQIPPEYCQLKVLRQIIREFKREKEERKIWKMIKMDFGSIKGAKTLCFEPSDSHKIRTLTQSGFDQLVPIFFFYLISNFILCFYLLFNSFFVLFYFFLLIYYFFKFQKKQKRKRKKERKKERKRKK